MINNKKAILETIKSNITNDGYHIYVIAGGASPRYAYTIGLSESFKYELILAGALFYSIDDAKKIIDGVVKQMNTRSSWQDNKVKIGSLGTFSLRAADASWVSKTMLGALDYYNLSDIPTLQILPDGEHWTTDIPDLSMARDGEPDPIWLWLDQQWNFPVPENSVAIINIDVIRGKLATEVMRWEKDEWEIFAGPGPDVPKENIRKVPLGTLLGADPSLYPVVNLDIGQGIWRDSKELIWNPWG